MESDFVIKTDIFMRLRTEPFEEIYLIHPKPIGGGAFGKVYKVRERKHPNAAWRAAKMYLKKNLGSRQQMLNELHILKRLDHPSIIKIYEVFQNETKIYVVQDFCEGGELFSRLERQGGLSQFEARRIFRQLLEGVHYCHSHKVCHRDLKPENILLLRKDSLELKIIDFGLAFEWQNSMREQLSLRSSKNVVGTAYYISPDILLDNNHYDERTDIWSLGVILYVLVARVAPFDGANDQQTMDLIANYKYSFNVPQMKNVSPQLKDLIKRLLVPASQRLTFSQIFEHSWMISEPNRTPIHVSTAGLAAFGKFSKTKRLVASFLAHQASSAEVERLTRMFQQIDTNRDGQITYDEMRKGLEKEGLKPPEIKALMDNLDLDHNGKVNYTEFLAGFSGQGLFTEDNIRRAFEMLDRDGNGVVQKKQLLSLFQESGMGSFNGKAVEAIVEECDKDGNGVIDFQEFKACLQIKQ